MKLISIDLESPLPDLSGCPVGDRWVLVRLHGHPMGVLRLEPRAYEGRELGPLVIDRTLPAIVHHLVGDGLHSGTLDRLALGLGALPRACPRPRATPAVTLTAAVCTRDGASRLPACLDALTSLDYPPDRLELLVVDNAPTDGATERLVAERYRNVRYVCEPRPGLDRARNRAIAESRGEIVAFTDDDAMVDAGWARALAAVFDAEPHAMAVTGLVLPASIDTAAQRLFEEYGGFGRGFLRTYYQVDRARGESAAAMHAGTGKFGTGANMAFRRGLFDRIGPFDPALDVGTPANGGGDLEMFYRVVAEGHMLVYEPAAIVMHAHRRTYGELRVQLANNGIGLYAYLARSFVAHPRDRIRFARFGAWWFWHWSIRRLFDVVTGRLRFPADLVIAELRGSVRGPLRYAKARRQAAAVACAGTPTPAVRRT